MTAVVETEAHADEHGHDEGHAHPSNAFYWKVGAFLAVMTALEISIPEVFGENALSSAALIVLMIIKFATVALFFMHLKYDAKILQNFLLVGLFLAIACYAVMAGTVHFWDDNGNKLINSTPRDQPLPPAPTDPPAIIRESGPSH